MQVGLIDYGRGNLRSVEKALQLVGASVQRLSSAEQFSAVDALVLPGVGSFGDAMLNLEQRGLVDPLKRWLLEGKSFLGICLGYQLLFESSEESPEVAGLGFLKGQVVRFPDSVGKVPHMGWNTLELVDQDHSLFSGMNEEPYFYHVHSYFPQGVDEQIVACRTEYGFPFASGIRQGKISAFQFHPEKSQENGLKLLKNFICSAD